MNAIQQATKDCQRTDCSLTDSGGVSTCMDWTPTYDKEGFRTGRGDPNITSWSIRCSTCKREWGAREQYGTVTVTERKA